MGKTIAFKKAPLTLIGRALKINTPSPNFWVTSENLQEVSLFDFHDKIKIIHSFPSLDTDVCDLQVKEFNKKASQLSPQAIILGISKDLPFAQKRFCDTFHIENTLLFSDYKTSSFGINYGLLIKELNLLARAAIILDKNDVVRHVQIADDLAESLDYEDLIKNLDAVIKNPKMSKKISPPLKCLPCEGKASPLSEENIQKSLQSLEDWKLIENKKIQKEFKCKDFIDAKYLLDLIAIIAQEQDHHPVLNLNYNRLTISLITHAAGGLTDNDFIIARIIDEIRI